MLQITEQLRDILVRYLATRPYQEVVQGIAELSQLKKIEEPKQEEAKNNAKTKS